MESRRSLIDLTMSMVVAFILIWFLIWTDVVEGLTGQGLVNAGREHVDEIIEIVTATGFALAFFAWRRWRDLAREIVRRKQVEEELQNYRKNLEAQVLARTADLQSLNEQLTLLLESLPISIYKSLAHGDYPPIYITKDISKYTGYGSKDFLGISCFWADRIHPDDRERVFSDLSHLGRKQILEHEYRWRIADGSYRWMNDHMQLVRSPDNSYDYIVGVRQDVTDRRLSDERIRSLNEELELRVRERTAELEGAYQELESFSYTVSHDLRNPLAKISLYSQMLLEHARNSTETDCCRFLRNITDHTLQMGRLIDALLDFARLPKVEMKPGNADLSDMAWAIATDLRLLEPDRLARFVIADSIKVNGDPRLLKTVLENLLGNAWKYTRKKEEAVIEFGVVTDEDPVTYYVRDNGAGFCMADAGKLFSAFQRLHDSEEFEGTGIGLATVERIVRRHGGRVWAEGEVEKGATFYFHLNNSLSERMPRVTIHGQEHGTTNSAGKHQQARGVSERAQVYHMAGIKKGVTQAKPSLTSH